MNCDTTYQFLNYLNIFTFLFVGIYLITQILYIKTTINDTIFSLEERVNNLENKINDLKGPMKIIHQMTNRINHLIDSDEESEDSDSSNSSSCSKEEDSDNCSSGDETEKPHNE